MAIPGNAIIMVSPDFHITDSLAQAYQQWTYHAVARVIMMMGRES